MSESAALLADALRSADSDLVLVVTGAGISEASGIPTFRGSDPDAIWRHSDVEMATHGFFQRDPVTHWSWYLSRFRAIESAQPNPAHLALAELERWQTARGGDFLLVTQNIDCLHEQAGSTALIKVHGTSDRLRCSRPGCRNGSPAGSLARSGVDLSLFEASAQAAHLPRCPDCSSLLRTHVLLFDEYYGEHHDYQFSRVERAAAEAGLVIFVGTSFSVGVTDLVLWSAASRRAPTFSLDPAASSATAGLPITLLPARAEELLPAVCRRLGTDRASSEAPRRGSDTGYTGGDD